MAQRSSNSKKGKTMTNTFKIGISANILNKARNFFNSTTEDILNEILQNCRRAGATKVKVSKNVSNSTVTIEDNGIGIFSKSVAINLGGSEWSSDTQDREDPAGCGLFSLANLDSVIESHGKKVQLNAEAFNGTREVEIEESDFLTGTRITFRNIDKELFFIGMLEKVCKYYPIQVEYNGVEIDKPKDFLEGAVYIEEWEGLKIGVTKVRRSPFSELKLNFYGLQINCSDKTGLKFCNVLGQDDLFVRVDIIDCPKLQLVLPSRKEVVSNDFLQQLFQQCRKVVFNYIKNHCDRGGSHTLPYKLWRAANESFGIKLPEAEQKLIKWYPKTDFYHDEFCSEQVDVVASRAVVYSADQHYYEQHSLYHALENNPEQISLVLKNTDYEGYKWYNSLPILKEVKTEVTCGSEKLSIKDVLYDDRPDFIVQKLVIEHNKALFETLTLPTDLVLVGEDDFCDLEGAIVILTENSKIKVEELVEALTLCFFCPSDSYDSDSYDTQAEYFSSEAWALARSLLLSEEEAVVARIKETVQNNISWLVPAGHRAVITAVWGEVTVKLEQLTEDAQNVVKE
ncbi:MAG: ATP-binding protein [Sphaerospermopsis kisseleviana]